MIGRLDVAQRAWRRWRRGEPELRLLPMLVDRRRAAIDVGANKGVYTYHLARLARSVTAYEPSPVAFPVVARCGLGNVRVVNAALSDRAGELPFHIPIGKRGLSSQTGSLEIPPTGHSLHEVMVEVRRLDDETHEDVGFIKIDVEGHEEATIRGGEVLIARYRPTLLVEIEARHIGKPVSEVFDYLRGLGYAGYFLMHGALAPVSRLPSEISQEAVRSGALERYINNFVFLPTD